MVKSIKLRVAESQRRDVGRFIVRVDSEDMQRLGVQVGDIVELEGDKITAAIAWPAYSQDQGKEIVRMDGSIRRNARASLSDSVTIRKANDHPAEEVTLAINAAPQGQIQPGLETIIKHRIISYPLTKDDIIRVPLGISGSMPFKVLSTKPEGIVIIENKTRIVISEKQIVDIPGIPYVTYEDIGGLQEEIQRVREMVELPLKHPELFKRLGIEPPKGVLLYGPPGSGKTLLAKAVANESEAYFLSINGPEIMSKFYGESEKRLRQVFNEAEKKAPSIIFIDEIDAIAPKRSEVTGEVERRVVAQLLASMDGLHSRGQVIVIGATNRQNAIDEALRRPGRFDREIEIRVPNKIGRMEILQIHTRGMPLKKIGDETVILEKLSSSTHGFVGADLEALCREAAMKALRHYLPTINLEEEQIPPQILQQIEVTQKDFLNAMREIQPSAMREVFVEIPNTLWSAIGGLDDVKQKLIEVIEWPLTKPESFSRIGITPPRGILLYGPPGCGKTLLIRAVATATEANFISIKGPEIISKWVGESEKAVREVFRKARMASPAIVFFDEIDAIAPRRGLSIDTGVSERVISQLLTEMDGLSGLDGVVVIAATNRPDILDPALLRSGRFDRLVLVDAPDLKTREAIIKTYSSRMPLEATFSPALLASKTEGFSGSDLATLCREAGIVALRENINTKQITMDHFEEALKQVHPTITNDMVKWYREIATTLYKRDSARTGREIL